MSSVDQFALGDAVFCDGDHTVMYRVTGIVMSADKLGSHIICKIEGGGRVRYAEHSRLEQAVSEKDSE